MILRFIVKKPSLMHYTLKSKNWRKNFATLYHKRLISKKLETAEMSLKGVLGVIFKVEEEEEKE